MKRVLFFTFAFLLFTFAFASSDCIPDKPSPPRLVNNFSKQFPDFLSEWEEEELEQKLEQFSKETSNQIVIVIVDDLCGTDANSFSTQLGHKWAVGQGKFDNGVVVMIKPTGGAGQRDAYIAVGYGLEGAIPDITSKQIVDNEILPEFKSGNFYDGLNSATDVLISLAKKEYSYKDYGGKKENWFPFLFGILFFILLFYFVFRNSRGYTMTSSGGRTYYGGGWSSWGGGGFGGGGGSGGFGGFGGGGFGGGGAGGKW
ncbi:MAG: TPM domain-containing protein [Bacteroidetes bacterium]|nr:TPM domain-containing protein [Bacteroidota bacterium]